MLANFIAIFSLDKLLSTQHSFFTVTELVFSIPPKNIKRWCQMKWTVQLKTIRQMVYAWKASNEIQHCFRQTANFARSTFIFRKNINWIKKIKITNQNLFEKICIYKRCILTPFLDSKLERMNLCSYRFKWFKNICCGISR